MNDILSDKEAIDQIVDELDRNLNSALYDIGFLEGTIGNPLVGTKISQSFSGHALDIAIRSVIVSTLLFVTRTWDDNGNSIPRLCKKISGWGVALETERKNRRPEFPDDFLEIGEVESKIKDLIEEVGEFIERPDFRAARLHRDEHVAHLLKGKSGYRRKLGKLGVDVDPVTYNEVIVLASDTAEFVSRILQIWKFTVKEPKDRIENSKKNTNLFWMVLPRLAEAEESILK